MRVLLEFDCPSAEYDGELALNEEAQWGVDSEYGILRDVMLSTPKHLAMVPCNDVTEASIAEGLALCSQTALAQHQALVEALIGEGIACHIVPPTPDLADLCFTRDATMMSPWGLIALSPAVDHRLAEVEHIRAAVADWHVPLLGVIERGRIEGGDVCLLRPGLVAIGYSGERTDEAGAEALARLFEARGWRAILTRFHRRFLHLDTLFTLVARDCAVACLDALEESFIHEVEALGIELIDITVGEVRKLGGNLLSLGGGRVLSSADNHRVNALLERRGYRVLRVEIDQFTRCGGGIHCLTMPLTRLAG